jgi:hypothetical protein
MGEDRGHSGRPGRLVAFPYGPIRVHARVPLSNSGVAGQPGAGALPVRAAVVWVAESGVAESAPVRG